MSPPHLDDLYHHKIVPLPPSLVGKALCVGFTAKDKSHSFFALNLYLDSHKSDTRASQLNTLTKSLPSHPYMIVGGDFNFVEDKYKDTSSHSEHYDNDERFVKAWMGFKEHFNLKEVAQSTHTYISNAGEPGSAGTSRLDRIYLSYAEADWATIRPYTYIARIPHTIISYKRKTKYYFVPSDHLPVSLAFKTTNNNDFEKGAPRIPHWVTTEEDFVPAFEQR